MKRLILLLMNTWLVLACSLSNPVTVMDNTRDRSMRMRLEQSPDVTTVKKERSLSVKAPEKVSTVYLFEEKSNARPEITLDLLLSGKNSGTGIDTLVFIDLEGEKIPLNSNDHLEIRSIKQGSSGKMFNQQFIIPENLWISIVHSRKVSYGIFRGGKEFQIMLSQKEKEKLAEFLKLAIQRRDAKFPAVPEGQVKW